MQHKLLAAMVAVLVAVFTFADAAEAARMGGGRSLGVQRQSIAPAARAPAASGAVGAPAAGAAAQPVIPAQPGALAPRAGAPAAIPPTAAAPRTGMSRFLGPIAGIAAGLGIAALLSHFGLPEGMGTFLLLALLAIAVVFIVRALLARRSQASMQYAGGTAAARMPAADFSRPADQANKPAWGGPQRVEPVLRANNDNTAGAAGVVGGPRTLPPGFDREGFLRQARMQFKQLQGAWDMADQRALANVMTPAMFAEVSRDLSARSSHTPTEVVSLDAEVLDISTENDQYWASVQFTGLLREDGGPTPKPFDETWNLTKPVDGSSGWLLAGIQQNEPAMTAH